MNTKNISHQIVEGILSDDSSVKDMIRAIISHKIAEDLEDRRLEDYRELFQEGMGGYNQRHVRKWMKANNMEEFQGSKHVVSFRCPKTNFKVTGFNTHDKDVSPNTIRMMHNALKDQRAKNNMSYIPIDKI